MDRKQKQQIRGIVFQMSNWFRTVLFSTTLINAVGCFLLFPFGSLQKTLRAMVGFPEPENPFYLLLISTWISLFGAAYLWLALRKKDNLMFFSFAPIGKLSFSTAIIFFFMNNQLGPLTLLAAITDFVLAILFYVYVIQKHLAAKKNSTP